VNFRQLRRPEVSINLTPLIDVVFLLLIFFMVSTSFSELTQLVVDLPEAEGSPASADDALLLTVDAVGNMTLNGESVPNDARGLSAALRQQLSGNTDIPVTLSADAMTPHQYVVTAMDVAAQLNITRLTIATENTR
jgi:biopolymer transport protein ExbD